MNPKSRNAVARKRYHKLSLVAASLCCTLMIGLMPFDEARATPGAGVTAQPMAVGILPESIRAKFKDESGFENGTAVANVVAVQFTIAPGGYFGWHRHGGPVWVIVEQGTLTLYDPDDPACARTYPAGTAFVDAGDHVHNARNEGTVPVVVYGTFLLPEGGALRVDAPDPGVCALPPL
jgi:quercetin dioxygenase-like cupin family protein